MVANGRMVRWAISAAATGTYLGVRDGALVRAKSGRHLFVPIGGVLDEAGLGCTR
jgi:hypothetical protein